jgi:ppGpp synthetase/RelA/SpoT-type nucleotidyltranferase
MSTNRLLDPHCQAILQEYEDNLPRFREVEAQVRDTLKSTLTDAGLMVAAIESRIKSHNSLAGKLELKGQKYKSLADLTDIIGLRVITFYIDDVDKVASAVERLFTIDWENSVDKRKIHEIDSFGYLSLHYICSVPDFPYRFEIQMRTLLQHAWANMDHDTGYKSGVEIPRRYLRNMSRLAGMLELVDDEFSKIRIELTDYRRRVQGLVRSGNLDEVPIDGDTFRSYLDLAPFTPLNKRIASMNQAEIQEVPLMPYLAVYKGLGLKTLGDISRMIKDYSEGAYQIACYQIGLTDLDIISSSIGPQDLCIAFILKNGGGKAGIKYMFDLLNGESENNDMIAEMLMEQSKGLPFMNTQQ